jgi:hypothetical protein
MPYDLFQHRHNFAVWAAARATQRGFTTTANLRDALENCGICEFLRQPAFTEITNENFEILHKRWCNLIFEFLRDRRIPAVSYGRAAKLVAIYLKTMVIIGGSAYTNLGRCAHPPIDRKLLRALARQAHLPIPSRQELRKINWTELIEEDYCALINTLRSIIGPETPFWTIEEYWTVV